MFRLYPRVETTLDEKKAQGFSTKNGGARNRWTHEGKKLVMAAEGEGKGFSFLLSTSQKETRKLTRNVGEEEKSASQPGLGVGDGHDEGLASGGVRGLLLPSVDGERVGEVNLLSLGEQSGGLDRVGKDESTDDGEDDGDHTLKQAAGKRCGRQVSFERAEETRRAAGDLQQPTPSLDSMGSVELQDSDCEQPSERISDLGSRVKDGRTKTHLPLGWKGLKRVR